METTPANHLTFSEVSTILASLRVFQRLRTAGGSLPPADPKDCAPESIAAHFDECDPLSDGEIDDLCERLNLPATTNTAADPSDGTPLPWRTEAYNGDSQRIVVGTAADGTGEVLIADCYPDSDEPFVLPDRREYQANARMIVAATALVGTIARLQKYGDEFEPDETDDAEGALNNLISQAREIIGLPAPGGEPDDDEPPTRCYTIRRSRIVNEQYRVTAPTEEEAYRALDAEDMEKIEKLDESTSDSWAETVRIEEAA